MWPTPSLVISNKNPHLTPIERSHSSPYILAHMTPLLPVIQLYGGIYCRLSLCQNSSTSQGSSR